MSYIKRSIKCFLGRRHSKYKSPESRTGLDARVKRSRVDGEMGKMEVVQHTDHEGPFPTWQERAVIQ